MDVQEQFDQAVRDLQRAVATFADHLTATVQALLASWDAMGQVLLRVQPLGVRVRARWLIEGEGLSVTEAIVIATEGYGL